MREDASPSYTPRLTLGLLVVAVGVLFTLDNLGLAEIDELWPFWPVILIVVGVARLISGVRRAQGLLWVVLGAILLLPVVSDEIEMRDLVERWPLFLIAFGVYTVWRSFGGGPRRGVPRSGVPRPDLQGRDEPGAPRSDEAAGAPVNMFSILSSVKKAFDGPGFRRGDLTALLGGCELDLTRAELAPEGASVEVLAFWGGIGIRVPKGWPVELKVNVLMGASEDNTRPPAGEERPGAMVGVVLRLGEEEEDRGDDSGPPRLVVRGFVLMGGIEVRN